MKRVTALPDGVLVSTVILVIALATLSPAPAQEDLAPGGPALREGNIYDHRSHQPTQDEVRAAKQRAGVGDRSSAESNAEDVETEVRELLQQTDQLDRQSEQDEQR